MLRGISENVRTLFARKEGYLGTRHIRDAADSAASKPLHNVDTEFDTATFGMGCFWGADSLYGAQKGVLRTRVGYSGGTQQNPVYRNLGDHTEVIEMDFDPTTISFKELLHLFWNNHEYGLTTKIKKQYASIIFYHSEDQKRIAEESRVEEQERRKTETIITEIKEFSKFYPAEDYHQKYRLQGHKDLAKQLGLTSKLLQSSHVAAKLNGYLVGVGGSAQFLEESKNLGLTEKQIEYVHRHVKDNEGGALYC